MAGLDGVERGLKPTDPVDVDLFELSDYELRKIKNVPGSLAEAMDALEADHEFLLKGDVFTQDLLDTGSSTSAPRPSRSTCDRTPGVPALLRRLSRCTEALLTRRCTPGRCRKRAPARRTDTHENRKQTMPEPGSTTSPQPSGVQTATRLALVT